jgi:hypothetical protein
MSDRLWRELFRAMRRLAVALARDRVRAGKRLWTLADDLVLYAHYPHESTAAIARCLRRSLTATHARAGKLGLRKTTAYLASPDACRLRRGDNPGVPFRYPKGHVPANKGLRRPGWSAGRMRETQFKPGVPSWRTMPIGSTRLVDGYVYVKVADVPNVPYTVNWLPLHILEWERVHGPLPAGHCLWFTDGDRRHVDVANLELHTRRENMARNSVHNLPQPLKDTVQLLGALNRQIRRRTRDGEHDRRSA